MEVYIVIVIFVFFYLSVMIVDEFFSLYNLVRNFVLFLKILSDKICVSRIIGVSLRKKRFIGYIMEFEIGVVFI